MNGLTIADINFLATLSRRMGGSSVVEKIATAAPEPSQQTRTAPSSRPSTATNRVHNNDTVADVAFLIEEWKSEALSAEQPCILAVVDDFLRVASAQLAADASLQLPSPADRLREVVVCANRKWYDLCEYEDTDVVGKAFSKIPGFQGAMTSESSKLHLAGLMITTDDVVDGLKVVNYTGKADTRRPIELHLSVQIAKWRNRNVCFSCTVTSHSWPNPSEVPASPTASLVAIPAALRQQLDRRPNSAASSAASSDVWKASLVELLGCTALPCILVACETKRTAQGSKFRERIVAGNQRWYNMCEYSESMVVGKAFSEIRGFQGRLTTEDSKLQLASLLITDKKVVDDIRVVNYTGLTKRPLAMNLCVQVFRRCGQNAAFLCSVTGHTEIGQALSSAVATKRPSSASSLAAAIKRGLTIPGSLRKAIGKKSESSKQEEGDSTQGTNGQGQDRWSRQSTEEPSASCPWSRQSSDAPYSTPSPHQNEVSPDSADVASESSSQHEDWQTWQERLCNDARSAEDPCFAVVRSAVTKDSASQDQEDQKLRREQTRCQLRERVVCANKRWCELFEYKESDVLGKAFSEIRGFQGPMTTEMSKLHLGGLLVTEEKVVKDIWVVNYKGNSLQGLEVRLEVHVLRRCGQNSGFLCHVKEHRELCKAKQSQLAPGSPSISAAEAAEGIYEDCGISEDKSEMSEGLRRRTKKESVH